MKVKLILASANPELRNYFRERKGKLLPNTVRKLGYNFDFRSIELTNGEGFFKLVADNLTSPADAFVLLIDGETSIVPCRDWSGCFVVETEVPTEMKRWNNYFSSVLSRAIGNLQFLQRKFQDRGSAQLLMLPIRAFQASDLVDLVEAATLKATHRSIRETIEIQLSHLKKRRTPKRNSRLQRKYIQDDVGLMFEFCLEKHAEAGTGLPHDYLCSVNKHYRLGIRLDPKDHYNVSTNDGSRLSGAFSDCHGDKRHFSSVTHLNVFPNGHIE